MEVSKFCLCENVARWAYFMWKMNEACVESYKKWQVEKVDSMQSDKRVNCCLLCFTPGSFGPSEFLNATHLSLSWENAFSLSEPGSLWYEVFAGAIEGAGAGFPALFTNETSHTFSRGRVTRGTPYYVTVKAVTLAGQYIVKEGTITAN